MVRLKENKFKVENRDVFENFKNKKLELADKKQKKTCDKPIENQDEFDIESSNDDNINFALEKKGANNQETVNTKENKSVNKIMSKQPSPIYFDHGNQYQQESTDIFSKIKSMRDKNKRLNSENTKLQKKLAEAREINNALHKELNEAIDGLLENNILEEKLIKANEKIEQQEGEISILKNQLNEGKNLNNNENLPSHVELEEQNFFLRVQLENLHEKFENKFIRLKEKLEEGNSDLISSNESLKARVETLLQENSELKTNENELNKKQEELEEKLKYEQNKVKNYQTDNKEVIRDLEDVIEQRERLEHELKALKAKVDSSADDHKIKTLNNRIEDYENQINALETQLHNEKDINAELRDCIDSMEQKLNRIVQEEKENQKNSESTKKLIEHNRKIKEEILRFSYKIDRLNQKIHNKEALADRLQAYSTEKMTKDGAIFDASLFKSINGCLDSLISRVDNIMSEHADFKRSNTIYINSSKEKEAQNKQLAEENEQLKQDLMFSEHETNDLKEQVDNLEEKCLKMEHEMQSQKEELVAASEETYEAEIKRLEDKLKRLSTQKNKQDLLNDKISNFLPDDNVKYLIENWVQATLDLQEMEERLIETQLSKDGSNMDEAYKPSSKALINTMEKKQEVEELKTDIEYKQKKKKELETKLLESEEKFKGMAAELTSLQNEASRLKTMLKNMQAPDLMTASFHSIKNRRSFDRPQSSQIRKTPNIVFQDNMEKSRLTRILQNFSSTAPLTNKSKEYDIIREKLNGLKKKYSLYARD